MTLILAAVAWLALTFPVAVAVGKALALRDAAWETTGDPHAAPADADWERIEPR